MSVSLRELQVNLPWTIRYSRDFRASPVPHKDFAHALHHVSKAAGRLHELADDCDHDRDVADAKDLRERYARYVADLVVCALRIANTFPGGVVDLEAAVVARIEDKNGVPAVASPDPIVESCSVPGDAEVELAKVVADLKHGVPLFPGDPQRVVHRSGNWPGGFQPVEGEQKPGPV